MTNSRFGLLLKLEVVYPNFETIKIPCIIYSYTDKGQTLLVKSYYDRFESTIVIPRKYVINVFLLGQQGKKLPLFR